MFNYEVLIEKWVKLNPKLKIKEGLESRIHHSSFTINN